MQRRPITSKLLADTTFFGPKTFSISRRWLLMYLCHADRSQLTESTTGYLILATSWFTVGKILVEKLSNDLPAKYGATLVQIVFLVCTYHTWSRLCLAHKL